MNNQTKSLIFFVLAIVLGLILIIKGVKGLWLYVMLFMMISFAFISGNMSDMKSLTEMKKSLDRYFEQAVNEYKRGINAAKEKHGSEV